MPDWPIPIPYSEFGSQHFQSLIKDATFTKPRSSQSRSRLMRIPRELRIAILRYLLRNPAAISTRQICSEPVNIYRYLLGTRQIMSQWLNVFSSVKDVRSFGLDPRVLATCQGLLQDGWPILYGENRLVIKIIGGMTLLADPDVTSWIQPYGDHYSQALVLDDHCLSAKTCDHPGILDEHLAGLVQRFAQIQIHVFVQDSDEVLGSFRQVLTYLRPTLTSKNLNVVFDEPKSDDRLFKAYVDAFQLLRCRSLVFKNIPNNITKNTTSMATSSVPILDLSTIYQRTPDIDFYLTKLGVDGDELDKLWEDLKKATIAFDANTFFNVRTKIFHKIDTTVDTRIQHLKTAADANGRKIKEMEQRRKFVKEIACKDDEEVENILTRFQQFVVM